MTICNVWVSPTRALVAVDTAAAGLNGQAVHTLKLRALPHLPGVMAGAGNSHFFRSLFSRYSAMPFDTFDDLLDATPELVGLAFDDALSEGDRDPHQKRMLAESGIDVSLVLVGYLTRQDRMLGVEFLQLTEWGRGFRADGFDYCARPSDPPVADPSELSTPELMETHAKKQVSWVHGAYPGAPVGGRLIHCAIEKDRMTLTQGSAL